MQIPKIGDTITNDIAIELCLHYGFDEIVQRIKHSPSMFKPWVFDGASGINDDALIGQLLGIPNIIEIALKHDLQYAYGVLNDRYARKAADMRLKQDILDDGGAELVAQSAYFSVRLGGDVPNTGYQWGFARLSPQEQTNKKWLDNYGRPK